MQSIILSFDGGLMLFNTSFRTSANGDHYTTNGIFFEMVSIFDGGLNGFYNVDCPK